MYNTIMIPVDLEHADKLDKALAIGADLAKHYDAQLYAVGVTASTPGRVAHTPAEYAEKLKAFTIQQSSRRGATFEARAVVSHDPTIDLDEKLHEAANEIGADLVIMASHVPGPLEHVIASRAGYLASHEDRSVFVVR